MLLSLYLHHVSSFLEQNSTNREVEEKITKGREEIRLKDKKLETQKSDIAEMAQATGQKHGSQRLRVVHQDYKLL